MFCSLAYVANFLSDFDFFRAAGARSSLYGAILETRLLLAGNRFCRTFSAGLTEQMCTGKRRATLRDFPLRRLVAISVPVLLLTHGEDTMIKDRHAKESSRNLASKPAASSTPIRYSCAPSQVAESPTQNWKKYTDSRMRQFSGGR